MNLGRAHLLRYRKFQPEISGKRLLWLRAVEPLPPAIRAWARRHQHQLTYTKGLVQRSKRLHLVSGPRPKDEHERVPLLWKLSVGHVFGSIALKVFWLGL